MKNEGNSITLNRETLNKVFQEYLDKTFKGCRVQLFRMQRDRGSIKIFFDFGNESEKAPEKPISWMSK